MERTQSQAKLAGPNLDSAWLQLKAEVEQEVSLVESTVELGGQLLSWLRVADPDILLQRAVEAQEAEDCDPFWAVAWRASQGLDRFLARVPIAGCRVLELGCGSGQAGFAAALRGACVLATDSVPLALKVARLNAWNLRERIDFQYLSWGRSPPLQEQFPLILGSDVVYDPNLFGELEACARRHLSQDGRWLLSEPHRHSGDKFAEWVRAAGWCCQEHDIDLQDGRVPVRIFECRLGQRLTSC